MLLGFRRPRIRWAAAAVLFAASDLAHADLNADFANCRREILRIGSNPAASDEQYCLGLSYAFNLNHPKDRARAAAWFGRAADQNHPGAQAVLGYLYEQGDGVPRDPVQAAHWYREAAAQGRDDGLFNLGRAYENGIGVAVDLGRARDLYAQAAAVGSRDAAQALANLGSARAPAAAPDTQFDDAVRRYKARDYAGAARIFLALAQEGHAAAQLQIGYQYGAGEGVSQDYREAERWYRESAAQGNSVAATNLGKLYEDGIGVPENWPEAVQWYRRAAAQGYPEAQFNFGRAYQFGIAVPQNRQEAIRWFDSAADQGHDQANYFANQLKARNSYIGFRNDAEHAVVVGTKLRTVLLNIEPVGQTFRSSAERMTYLRSAGQQADREEAWQRWNSAKMNYDNCQDAGRSGCIPPGPPP